jgi:hypothetical protein
MTRIRMRLHCGQRPKMYLRPAALIRTTDFSHGSVWSHFKQRIYQAAMRFLGFVILY